MSSIWIILLDTSGSMGNGFSERADKTYDPLAETGAWATKLDAAKELLLRQVASLRAQDVAVIQFTDSFEVIFYGPREQLLKSPKLIQKLEAKGCTSIANALDGVHDNSDFEKYRSISILVLTDGLSDNEAATASAELLAVKYPFVRVDTILIDETGKGRTVAENISINGTVRTAISRTQLENEITSVRIDSLQTELSHMALHRFQAQNELFCFNLISQPTLLTVTSHHSLTASDIQKHLVPTLAGLEAFGRAISYAAGKEFAGRISSISQDSPISINLSGFNDAIELEKTYFNPWRLSNAERLAELAMQKQELEVEQLRRNLAQKDLDLDRNRIENLLKQYELEKSKWELAEKMQLVIDPDSQLRGRERERALTELLSGIEQLSSTRLEFSIADDKQWHKN